MVFDEKIVYIRLASREHEIRLTCELFTRAEREARKGRKEAWKRDATLRSRTNLTSLILRPPPATSSSTLPFLCFGPVVLQHSVSPR